jgi:hypothetical protein
MLKIFVLLPCSNDWLPALSFNLGKDIRIAKTKISLNHYEEKLKLNY